MRDLILLFSIVFFIVNATYSQVGIGTTDPTAELEIETTSSGIPALEINPQTTPTGTANGQITVINNKLYMFDTSRGVLSALGKWLSVETTTLPYARGGNNRNNQVLRFGGVVSNQNSGALMPFDGTIVVGSARISGGDATKQFSIEVRNGATVVSTTNFNLTASEYTDTTLNIDFSAGDYIIARISNVGTTVNNPNLILWVKWRQ